MKYMLMMNAPARAAYEIMNWPQSAFKAHIEFMKEVNHTLVASGELVTAEGLAGPDQAKRVRAGKDGETITDGIFPETKEYLAGYWIVDVESPERAYAIAAHISTAPGKDGGPLNMPLEVRQVMSVPPPC